MRARLRRKQSLVRGEAQRDVNHDPRLRERAAGLEAIPGQRHFHRYILSDFRELPPLGDHRLGVESGNLRAHGSVDDGANLADRLNEIPPRLRHKRRVRGHAVKQTLLGEIADLGHVGRVDEEFHGSLLFFEAHSRKVRRLAVRWFRMC